MLIREKQRKLKMKSDINRGAWVIGGTTLIGVGVGLVFLETSALLFVASTITGIGLGLVIARLIPKDRDQD